MTDCVDKILQLKKSLGDKLVILAHHYQAPEIVKCGDIIGDSYMLAVKASKVNAPYIIMCGVKFMAESVRILARSNQTVIMPEVNAGCPMADMVTLQQATDIMDVISKQCSREIVPVVYMNSYADMKHFCGIHGGSVCTSSNASSIVKYYLSQDKAVLFFPDYNLGANTAVDLGVFDQSVQLKRDFSIIGDVKNAKMFLWDGFCPRHKVFTTDDVEKARKLYPDGKVIVHPECSPEVVSMSDISGSTEKIKKEIESSPAGSTWLVGTETNFVLRIANENPNKTIVPLKTSFCVNMSLTTPENLTSAINNVADHIRNGTPLFNTIEDDLRYKSSAMQSLNKMIEIVEQ